VEEHDYQHHLNLGTESSALSANKIRFWSDFNRVYYHPRSLVQIYETELGPEQRAFTTWEAGEDLFESLDRENDLFERDVRPFIEECDQMQGLQMMTSVDDGWSGFASKYMDRLRDELGKGTIWVLASQEASTPQQQVSQEHLAAIQTQGSAKRRHQPENQCWKACERSTISTSGISTGIHLHSHHWSTH